MRAARTRGIQLFGGNRIALRTVCVNTAGTRKKNTETQGTVRAAINGLIMAALTVPLCLCVSVFFKIR